MDPDLIDGRVFGDPSLIGTPFADLVGTANASFCSIWANGK